MTEKAKSAVIAKDTDVKVHNDGSKEFELPSGKIAIIKPFKFKHIQEAQKISGTNTENFIPAIIAITTTIDGKPVIMEDVIDMDGWDGLELMGKFSGGLGK